MAWSIVFLQYVVNIGLPRLFFNPRKATINQTLNKYFSINWSILYHKRANIICMKASPYHHRTQAKRESLCLGFRAGFFAATRDLKFIRLKASRKVDKEIFLPELKKWRCWALIDWVGRRRTLVSIAFKSVWERSLFLPVEVLGRVVSVCWSLL